MRSSKLGPRVIFLTIGALIFVVAFGILEFGGGAPSEERKFWSGALVNLAFVLLTVVIVDILWGAFGGDPVAKTLAALDDALAKMRTSVELLQDSKISGLERVYGGSGTAGGPADWMDRLKGARSNIDLVGYTLLVWTRGMDFENEVVRFVRAGGHARVLIMDEGNPLLNALVNHRQIPAITPDIVRAEIAAARTAFRSIAAKLAGATGPGSFEFRTLKEGLVVTQLCRTDHRISSIQYLYSAVASRSPLLEVRGIDTELGRVYMEEYESLWALGHPAYP